METKAQNNVKTLTITKISNAVKVLIKGQLSTTTP